ncbi:MAG TPA: hypothetical protein VLD84_09715 [Nitrososphaeraceae archaeon]|nr:hypothetical protein [Nitrososphaeraceae archaeon]
MQKSDSDMRFTLLFFSIIALVFSIPLLGSSNKAIAAGTFTIESKINLQNLNGVGKLKVVTSANGDTQIKNVTGSELKSKSTTVSFQFNQKNNIVSVGSRDEFFSCAYALDANTNRMLSYSCVEGNIEQENGKNTVNIGSGHAVTLSTGSFQAVDGPEIKNPTLRIAIPLSDRKDAKEIKVVTMIKGEFQSKTIDAQKLLKQSKDNTIIVPFVYDKQPEIGPIQVGDLFFACVSADELNPPEGTECEHRVTIHTGHMHNLVAR